ncbi:insulinase family protein [Candidatus Liberibacter africanus]|uniref:M16 family peptidase n=1 Tax=Candidatus Liberibacter africanus PTSAPSY TaxID=1277257 RepID=A0A0G3I2S9_LIBAF|nr:pitrilysin family protein [Candidatus Liberibacter africanus]AKK20191.1 M16 family peptidase [Candidatus Liberibacter africanus PTSAPSY]QTP63975.1 insulinase family protein [Candidatus Liberibacter africanus]
MNLRISKTSSGITVITEVIPYVKSAFVGINISSGSRHERKEEHGMAHFLEHMLFRGTTKRTSKEIVEEIENVGGDINAYTSVEHTSYHARVLEEDVPLALDIIGDMISNSVFNPSDIAREKNIVLEEIGMSEDNPWSFLYDRFLEVSWKDQIIGRSILGKPDTVSSFTSEHIVSYISRNYTADRMYIVCVGAVDHESCVSQVEKCFNVLPMDKTREKLKKAVYTGGEYIQHRDLAEEHMVLGFNGCAYQSSDFYTTKILASILGGGMSSRLFQEVREKRGLCYSISAHHNNFSDNGVFCITTATSKENVMELTSAIVEVLQSLLKNIEQKEITNTCAKIRAQLIMNQEDSDFRASEISKQTMFRGNVLCNEEIMDTILAITCSDIIRVAKRIFSSMPTLAILGSPMDRSPTTAELMHIFKNI